MPGEQTPSRFGGVKHYFLLMIILIAVKVELWPDQGGTIEKAATEHFGSTVHSIVAYNANCQKTSQVPETQGDTTPMAISQKYSVKSRT
jgi:hypothetical protein